MKTKRIIAALQDLLDGDGAGGAKRHEALEKLVGKLKKKEVKLRARIAEAETDDDRERFESKLVVNLKQQKKGAKALSKS